MRSLPPVFCADPFGQGAKLKIRSNLSHHQFTQDHIGFPTRHYSHHPIRQTDHDNRVDSLSWQDLNLRRSIERSGRGRQDDKLTVSADSWKLREA
jgi:hypothetical protein